MLGLFVWFVASQACAGDVNDGPQRWCGTKTFQGVTIMEQYFSANGSYTWNGRQVSGFVQGDLVLHGYLRSMLDDEGLTFSTRRGVMSTGPDIVIRPETRRDAGSALSIVDGAANEYFSIGNDGTVTLRCSNNNSSNWCGGLVDGTGGSGHVFARASNGLYLSLAGDLPVGYWGLHGSLTFRNRQPMIAGYLAEFVNPDTGTATEKKLMVNYQGGLAQFGAYTYNPPTLAPCDGETDHIQPLTGLPSDYVATDAGRAAPGTMMWVNDMKRWCHCEPTTNMDGGILAGWKRYDGQGCNVP